MVYPSKLTREVHEGIVALVKSGISLDYAAEKHNVSREAIRLWMRQGERDIAAGKKTTRHAKLTKEIQSAKGTIMSMMEGTLVHAAVRKRDWKAAVTYMERTDPARWGKKDMLRIEVDSALQELLVGVRPLMPFEHFQSLVKAIATIQGVELPDETEPLALPG